ncbi:putative anucleate primary sterigmata (ApsB) [Aspergillus clavatus NRRL 1]|uniref:Anucleate primary sterigmata (ApsB), putative n=1 Tax=Aspergillus clavatus (strain ATCC 1007 / CBS 513.65 / DSM 816 / NCTC 3887 / NRRL 1 / QM 1276 / 107) TaxID=344612 RepID=A1CJ44_ASPCL|nr:anucleate primary sterigmata (ApsB), putative [Aspergillus clavatus NRRL 1]EAW09168.1 anucleate primary sterigmata (ApsB), putative [Aspergillus clavatus NRRL 1]
MSTESAPSSPSQIFNPIECTHLEHLPSCVSIPDDLDSEDDFSTTEDVFCDPVDLMVVEDTRGDSLPGGSTTMDDTHDTESEFYHTQDETTLDLNQYDEPASTIDPSDHEDSIMSHLPPLPDHDDSSLFLSSDDGDHERADNQTFLEEKEMRRKLMDMESSFLPEPSTIEVATRNQAAGVDDTFLIGVPSETAHESSTSEDNQSAFATPDDTNQDSRSTSDRIPIPQTPTLGRGAANPQDLDVTPSVTSGQREDKTTMLEIVASSPAAEAATRSLNRVQSGFSADLHSSKDITSEETGASATLDLDRLTHPSNLSIQTSFRSSDPERSRLFQTDNGRDTETSSRANSHRGSRPKYLTSRQSSHRLSYSSIASNNTETTNSDATLGADYALQSGGAVPENPHTLQVDQRDNLTRSISLGSMASGISALSDENILEKRNASGVAEGGLQTLAEEERNLQSRPGSAQQQQQQQQQKDGEQQEQRGFAAGDAQDPMTPRAKSRENAFPTDTAIAERIRDVQVPSAFARKFQEDLAGRSLSPDKRAAIATPGFARSGRTMTLKEQSSTIDRLSKENFDLKMRIHFLNEALNRRSEEGIKELISENVELKSDKLKLQKDNQSLKRKIRDLEKQLKDQQSDKESMANHDPEGSDEDSRDAAQDEEILYLRERMETYELEIERLRSESMVKESEKRRLAEMVKALSDRPAGSEVGAREERVLNTNVSQSLSPSYINADMAVLQDMWKDMLDAEAAAREQVEDENKRLQDEVLGLRNELNFLVAPSLSRHRDRVGSMVSYTTVSDRDIGRVPTLGSSSSETLVEELRLLRQENAELRREVSAQTSMLTSRNKEKERLYQEIEELKLGQRRDGGRSVAGDSIFDRSASRAHGRSPSRVSDGTGPLRGDHAEREDLELRIGELRDQVSALKLENQTLKAQMEERGKEYEALDTQYQEEADQLEEWLQAARQECDQVRQEAAERVAHLEAEYAQLEAEAQEELDMMDETVRQKTEECQQLEEELRSQDENLRALQAEMRSASEGIIRLEEDAQNNLQRYEAVQRELENCNQEMETLEKNLYEANTKVQRLTVQIESSQNEIAFLREEQEGDKIRIGDLESELKTYLLSLQSERDKTRELEARLAEERHQREVVGSQEKQEVQRIVNELNREASMAKEEARKLKKSLSAQEIETATWRERLMDLENNLRETLGDLTGSRSSLISNIMKLQKELESTALELESVRSKLDETESLLRNRDALLESHGLESRKLAELLERERQARRADKQSFEQALKSHHQASRTITQSNSRITELENARNQDRKRFTSVEQQFREQLNERNSMLLTMWKRLSAMCGPDWAHSNSLINGNLPSQEVIGNILFWPGFSRNLLLAVKTVESKIAGFKSDIRGVERDLTKQYQNLEHIMNLRIKKLDRLEESMMSMRAQQHSKSQSGMSPEMAKLRGENRLLKAELNLLQSNSRIRGPTSAAVVAAGMGQSTPHSPSRTLSAESGADADPSSLVRHRSIIEKSGSPHLSRILHRSSTSGIPQPSQISAASSSSPLADHEGAMVPSSRSRHVSADPGGNDKWIQRLRELEKRLKAEREARLLDRNGARKRLEERDAENQRLRAELERHRMRRGISAETSTDDDYDRSRLHNSGRSNAGGGDDYGRHRDEEQSSSEGEGICVDIEV